MCAGSDAEFVVLKQKVEDTIKNHMKATQAKAARLVRETQLEIAMRKVRSLTVSHALPRCASCESDE
jgi:hypothetical protein